MASVKVKFRPSSVKDREGTLSYQIIHLRQIRQIYTDIHIRAEEWDPVESDIIVVPDIDIQRRRYLASAMGSIRDGLAVQCRGCGGCFQHFVSSRWCGFIHTQADCRHEEDR